MSEQLKRVQDVFNNHKDQITQEMIETADEFIKSGKSLESERAYDLLFNDGLFTPFFNADDSYIEFAGNEGNEEDETRYLSCVWISVLTTADFVKYQDIIFKHAEIMVNGL
jgi:hypothetical protein